MSASVVGSSRARSTTNSSYRRGTGSARCLTPFLRREPSCSARLGEQCGNIFSTFGGCVHVSYLSLGLAFGYTHVAIDGFRNGALVAEGHVPSLGEHLGFATLTTLGCGDLASVAPAGRLLSMVRSSARPRSSSSRSSPDSSAVSARLARQTDDRHGAGNRSSVLVRAQYLTWSVGKIRHLGLLLGKSRTSCAEQNPRDRRVAWSGGNRVTDRPVMGLAHVPQSRLCVGLPWPRTAVRLLLECGLDDGFRDRCCTAEG